MIARSALTAASASTKRCYLHVGTHKTGTTSVQSLLAEHAHGFAASGLYVPTAGRVSRLGGHHNVAWELNADKRFDAARGTLDDVLAEIAHCAAPRVCLSSEDFEYLHDRPHGLRRIADGLSAIGYEAVVIVYLRPQAGYAESLYAELVKHGLAQTFDAFLDTILTTGEYRFADCWRFAFDYERLLDGFAAVFGSHRIIARHYAPDGIVADFMRAIGVDPPPGGSQRRLNAGMPCAEVLRCWERNATGGVSRRLLQPADGRFDPVQLREVGRIVERFNESNRRVHARYGALVPCVSGRDVVADVAAAVGIDPAGRYRRQLVSVLGALAPARSQSTLPPAEKRPARSPSSAVRSGLRRDCAARGDAAVILVAGAAAAVALFAGESSDRTALVVFGLVSVVLAASAAGRFARHAFDFAGVILDRRFFDEWAARLRIVAYAIVVLYASVNAALDLDARRFTPDALSVPGLLAAAAGVIVPSLAIRERARSGDDELYVVCGAITLLLEMAHAAMPAWWLDTTIGLVVAAIAMRRMFRLWTGAYGGHERIRII